LGYSDSWLVQGACIHDSSISSLQLLGLKPCRIFISYEHEISAEKNLLCKKKGTKKMRQHEKKFGKANAAADRGLKIVTQRYR
jgi:hypothetical protein